MNQDKPNIQPNQSKILIYLCAGLSFFFVLALWGFWDKGLQALGLNAGIFLLTFLGIIIYQLKLIGRDIKKDLIWLIPVAFIFFSYFLYENPFVKACNFLVIPISLATFLIANNQTKAWSCPLMIIAALKGLLFSPPCLLRSIEGHFDSFSFKKIGLAKQGKLIRRILAGIIISAIILFTLVIPLLSSADQEFAQAMSKLYHYTIRPLIDIFEIPLIAKILFGIALSLYLVAQIFSWTTEVENYDSANKKIDSLVAGIIIAAILFFYLLFIAIQLKHIWVGQLPIEFKQTERLVKSGFWQLFFLTLLNIIMFLACYKKTNKTTQNILAAFTMASLILLTSAGERMFLYVWHYGFSYEKLFASYTVIYCSILFLIFNFSILKNSQLDIIKTACILFIWMYGICTVLPLESMMVRANLSLSQIKGTRINLHELRMFSSDAAPALKSNCIYALEALQTRPFKPQDCQKVHPRWASWISKQKRALDKKAWYEYTLSALIARHNFEL